MYPGAGLISAARNPPRRSMCKCPQGNRHKPSQRFIAPVLLPALSANGFGGHGISVRVVPLVLGVVRLAPEPFPLQPAATPERRSSSRPMTSARPA